MKLFITILFLSFTLFAKTIDALAVVVNDEPITTYEIEETASKLELSKNEALKILIQKKLEESQIKKLGITIDEFELQDTLSKFAASKGLDIFTLQERLQAQGVDWDDYKKSVKEQLLKKKLFEAIAKSALKLPSERELKKYYQEHKDEFSTARSVDVIKYISPSKEALMQIKTNPLASSNLVQKGEEKIDLAKIDPQFANLLNQTKEGDFTPILPLGDKFLLLYVKKKEGMSYIPFEEARGYILNKFAKAKESQTIKDYFAKLKASAKIKIIRLP